MCFRDSRSLPVFPVDPEVCVILRLCVSGIVGLYPCFPSILKCVWSSGCVFQGQSVFTRVSRRSWSVCDPPAVCFRDSRSLPVFPVDPGVCVIPSGCVSGTVGLYPCFPSILECVWSPPAVFQGQSVFTRVSRRSWSVCDPPAVCFRDSRSLPVFPVDPEVCVILRLCFRDSRSLPVFPVDSEVCVILRLCVSGILSLYPSILKCVWSSGCVSGIVGLYPCFPSILKCVWSSGCVFQGYSVFTRRSWSVCDPPAVFQG